MKRTKKLLAIALAVLILLSTSTTAFAYILPLQPSPSTSELSARELENAALSRKAGAEGMVLLKNEGKVLPLASNDVVALFGATTYNTQKGGTGSGDVRVRRISDLYSALVEAEAEGRFKLDAKFKADTTTGNLTGYWAEVYQAFLNAPQIPGSFGGAPARGLAIEPDVAPYIEEIATSADKAVITIGRVHGEGADRVISADRTATAANYAGQYNLTAEEVDLLSKVTAAFHAKNKPVVVVLNIGGAIDTRFVAQYGIDAVLLAGLPGQEAGYAIADVLTGKVNPSGKLADTYATNLADYPSNENFGNIGAANLKYNVYAEGMYVGYRYFETFGVDVNFPFGFGLSYTTFDTKLDSVSVLADHVVVKATVTNTGSVAGKEVVQVYYGAPDGKLEQPTKELAAFAKTDVLQPGAKQTLTISYKVSDMASYDESISSYIMEDGTYKIYVGNSVKNVVGTYDYVVAQDIVTEQLSKITDVKMAFEELKKNDEDKRPTAYTSTTAYSADMRTVPGAGVTNPAIPTGKAPIDPVDIQLIDVYEDPSLMDSFIGQADIRELFALTSGGNYANGNPYQTKNVSGVAGHTKGNARLGIPSMALADGPAGVRINFAGTDPKTGAPREQNLTAWPSSTVLAQTWDVDLMMEVGKGYGSELFEYDIELLLSPGMNIHRHPLGARNFEYYSEDPILSGLSAAAVTKGIQTQGSGVTLKHFAANNQETNRMGGDTIVSERVLREIYLKGYEIAVKTADPWAIMTSYNRINGIYPGQSKDLMTTVLDDEWGFNGLAMTDWGASWSSYAGTDLGMSNSNDTANYTAGRTTIEDLRASVKDVLTVLLKTKAFADYAGVEYQYNYESGDNWFDVEKSGVVSAPASAYVNEDFTIHAVLDRKYTGVKLVNESGSVITISSLSVARDVDTTSWDITTKLGSAGTGRVIKVLAKTLTGTYEDIGLSISIDILKNTVSTGTKAEVISAVFAKDSVKVNAPVTVTVTTNSAATKVAIFNENGGNMGKTLISKTQTGSKIVWVYEISIGSAGNRLFSFAAAKADGVYSDLISLATIKVTK